MNRDAGFEDGREAPLNLGALDVEDLHVISSLAQDAVFPIAEMAWQPQARRFALLINRFRWEEGAHSRHGPERVQALLVADNVLHVASRGIDRADRGAVLSLLSVAFEAGKAGAGVLHLTFAGGRAIRLTVEALEVTLRDVTRPYQAPSGQTPDHGG